MKKYLFILFCFFGLNPIMANANVDNALNEYAWLKRQLIVFTPSEDHNEYQKLKKTLKSLEFEIQDRKLHTWHVINNETVSLNYLKTNDFTNEEMRSKYAVDIHEFIIVLIGYDQEEKLRLTRTDLNMIFHKIDQMPMRIQEQSNQ